ncbi:MAG TPA: carboxypeptidase regulatory-like domain-containing protein [Vicinamibacterales bacterium]|nr:carboxypeptidase regulatory-like domain-containing protein [Vicinamibacterales bacterium]
MTDKWRSLVLAAVLSLAGAASALAQSTTGTITGRAVDSSGGILPGVAVSITSPQMIGGAREAVTDSLGTYRFTSVPPGTYQVKFQLASFRALSVEGVVVTANATMTVNAPLQVESLAESVTVVSTTPTIDLQSTQVGVNWSEKQMEDLPYGRGIRGLARLVPGLSPTQFDVGGNTVGGSTTTGARSYGRSGGELIKFDGVVWDQFFGDYNTYDQVQVSAAAKGAESQSPGVTLSFLVKSGGNKFSGNYLFAQQTGAMQGNNVTPELRAQGFDPGNNKFTRYNDISLDLGGPIIRDKLWFYGAYGYNYSGLLIPGFISVASGEQVEYFTRLDNPTLKLTYQMSRNNKFEITEQLNRKWQPYRNASAFVPMEATQNQIAWTAIGPALKFTRIMSDRMTFDASFNRSGYWWPDFAWTDDVRKIDVTTTQTRGAFLELRREPVRWGWNGTWSWFRTMGSMNHEIKSGFLGYNSQNYVETYGYPNQQIYRYRSVAGETDYFLHPDSVQVFEYPNNTNAGVIYHSWFANDSVNITPKLTVNAGLRFDHYSSWLPEQGNAGTGPYATARIIPETHGFPVYNAISPRVSAVYDLTGSGRVALKASYGRYAASGSGVGSAAGPVASSVNPAATLVSTYNRWDGRIPYTPVAADLASITGSSRDTKLDPSLKGEYLDEYTGGVDLGLWPDTSIRFNVVRKRDYRGSKVLNLAQPYEAFTDVVNGIDPGRDNITGTADDKVVQVYSVPRTYPGFGQIRELTVNAADGEGDDRYTAFETTFSKSYSHGWSLLGSYSIDRRDAKNIDPRNPNEALYGIGTTGVWALPETYQGVRMSGTYELPWQMLVASTFTAQQGEYFNRIVQVRDALNTTVNLTVEGQAGRYDWVKLADLRFSKSLRLKGGSLEGMVDVFNLFNTSVVLRRITTNGPNYNKPLASSGIDAASANPIPAARIFRLSARYRF